MNRSEIENELRMLKMDYARLQGDIEKLESVGRDAKPAFIQLERIEEDIKKLKTELRAINESK